MAVGGEAVSLTQGSVGSGAHNSEPAFAVVRF